MAKELGSKLPWPFSVFLFLAPLSAFDPLCFSAKHILGSDPSALVLDSLKGLCELNPKIALDAASRGATEHIRPISFVR